MSYPDLDTYQPRKAAAKAWARFRRDFESGRLDHSLTSKGMAKEYGVSLTQMNYFKGIIGFKRDSIDWFAVDWTMSDESIADLIDLPIERVVLARRRYALPGELSPEQAARVEEWRRSVQPVWDRAERWRCENDSCVFAKFCRHFKRRGKDLEVADGPFRGDLVACSEFRAAWSMRVRGLGVLMEK